MDRGLGLAIACAALSTACGQLFGLDPPQLVADGPSIPPADTDGDGVPDPTDNCPATANPDQIDTDKNGIGDRCEGCVALALRAGDDDDGDAISDPTDTCFGHTANSPDADADGIADACDPRNGADVRFCVWTFRDPGAGEAAGFWTTSWDYGNDWEVKDSALVHGAAPLTTAAVHGASFDAAGGVAYDTLLHLSGFTTPMTFGLGLVIQASQPVTYSCHITASGSTTPTFEIRRDATVVRSAPIPAPIPQNVTAFLRFGLYMQGGTLFARCTLDAAAIASVSIMQDTMLTTAKVTPQLMADQADVSYDHIALFKLGL